MPIRLAPSRQLTYESDKEPMTTPTIKLTSEEELDVLMFAMSFGHEPTAKETLEVLKENGYSIVKSLHQSKESDVISSKDVYEAWHTPPAIDGICDNVKKYGHAVEGHLDIPEVYPSKP